MNPQSFDQRALEAISKLQNCEYDSWFVGGCVRDTLCGKQFTDYDLATVALPEDIIKTFKNHDVSKEALEFGCVRINYLGLWLEITTLRQDINPDGRYTEVIFTNDLKKDALRRDFTINALYWDGKEASTVVDFFKGQTDLFAKKVRFIGDADSKVQEDFLRILRFFRFSAIYGDEIDPKGVASCEKHKNGLAYLSGNRVWSEWSKMLFKPNTTKVLHQIRESEIDIALFGVKLNLNLSYQGSDSLLFTRLLLPSLHIEHLAHRLNLNKKESNWLKMADLLVVNQDFRELYLEYGAATYELVYYWAAKFRISAITEFNKPFWKVLNPKFPLTGQDLLNHGCIPGPLIGEYLKKTKNWWIQNDFTPTHEECLNYAMALFK